MKRLQDLIKQVSIAAEDRGFPEGAEHIAQLAKEAGFQRVEVVQTKGNRGVFAKLDAERESDPFNELSHVVVIPDVHETNCSRLGAKNEAKLQTDATFEVVRS